MWMASSGEDGLPRILESQMTVVSAVISISLSRSPLAYGPCEEV